MSQEQTDALRAVITAARRWRREVASTGEEAPLGALTEAVDALEALIGTDIENQPTGFIVTRPWSLVPAGWFVRVPNGDWYEVLSTRLHEGRQFVGLRAPDGKTGEFPRQPDDKVKARRGSQTTELSDAIEALSDIFGGTAIIEDKPPWDEDCELADEFREAAKSAVVEWCRSWPSDKGEAMRARYFDDGVVEIERETETGFDYKRVTFDIVVKDEEEK